MKLVGKTLCLLCNDTIAVLKEYNICQHFHTKLYHSIPSSQESKNQKKLETLRQYLITTEFLQKIK